jgi:hypothetical protein
MRFCRKLTMSLIYSFQQLNKQLIMNTTSKVIDIYIPRILGDVSNNIVKNAFYNLNIGKVIELDMHRKKNENGYYYFFAFLKVELMDSEDANRLCTLLEERGIMHLVYDEEATQYWEIKKHVPKSERKKVLDTVNCLSERITANVKNLFEEASDYILPLNQSYNHTTSIFTYQDRLDMMREYEELEREIYQLTCC